MDDDIRDRLLSDRTAIEYGIEAIRLVEHDRCIYDEEYAETQAQVDALERLNQTIIETVDHIDRLRTKLALGELVRLSEELGLYELDADDVG
jgi:uncharacterized coiled-coil protein SlyX